MVSFGHTAIGVVIGISAEKYFVQGNLITGLITTGGIGVLSHYIADFIPHGHFAMPKGFKKGILKIIIFDLFLSIVLFLGAIYLKEGVSSTFLYVLFGIGGSQLPDVLGGLVEIKAIKAKGLLKVENAIHEGMHWHGHGNKTLLLSLLDVWQLIVVLIAFSYIIF